MSQPSGLYESILTAALHRNLDERAKIRPLGDGEAARRLADHFADHLVRALGSLPAKDRLTSQVSLVNQLIKVVEKHASSFPLADDAVSDRLLEGIRTTPDTPLPPAPRLPLSESGLYVNANRERRLDGALQLELQSADRVDLICAFLFWTGYVRIRPQLKAFLAQGRSLRVLTTVYRGVTQARVLDDLRELGADVHVSYETGNTRLHAKAWMFYRDSGFSTAFVGSSNLSHSALTAGLEWNVRLSEIENRAVLEELRAAFENHWNDEEFEPYDADTFAKAIRANAPRGELRAVFKLQPRPFQRVVLERLTAEREVHDRHRNLVVSATGTGKTVIAALDYARLCASRTARPNLLFVAHRKEILEQSRDMFRHAVSDGSFGELYVGGQRPLDWTHVFASVQSLSHADLTQWPKDHFGVVIVDEFHHAAATTYESILDYFEPSELVGLTATPERADGKSILTRFDGQIASELRIWDAIDRGLLAPFQYFAIHDTTDLRDAWKNGGYDTARLEGLFTGHHARAHLIIESMRDHVHDPMHMRALAFCVSVDHATFMNDVFNRAGIRSAMVVGTTTKADRRQAIKDLRDGTIACIVTVDVFNEGVDIPEVDTVLFLRPTESATLFLQQLGRGLRLSEGKRCLTVLDFVGFAHDRFRYVDRLRALVGRMGRKALTQQIEQDFPFLPSGCCIQLDRVSKEIILENVSKSLRLDRRSLITELRDSGAQTLAEFLRHTDLELAELYRGGRTFSELARAAGLDVAQPGPQEGALGRGLARLVHIDDRSRLDPWRAWLRGATSSTVAIDPRVRCMLTTTLLGAEAIDAASAAMIWKHPAIRLELLDLFAWLDDHLNHTTLAFLHQARLPLQVHGTYRLQEIMSALHDIRSDRLYLPREGVHFDPESRCNCLFVTLHKDADDYSPTTMYADYALGPDRFHWQSQSGTRPTDKKGKRHVRHKADAITPLLFVRSQKKDDRGVTIPYQFLGPVELVSATGERPMNVEWKLAHPMPAATLKLARVVA